MKFALDFAAFVGSATLCAILTVATLTSACQAARVGYGSGKVSQVRDNGLESRPQDGLGQPVNTGRHIGGKRSDLYAATARVAGSGPDFERSSSLLHNVVALGEAGMASARGVHHEPGLAASPGGRAGAYLRFARVAAHLCGVDEPILFEMISRESEWRQVGADGRTLRSRSGALGLTQIKASTARDVSPSLDPHDAAQNLIAGACYLRQQFDRFGSWRKALHAYHAGPWRRTTTRATLAYASDIITKGSAQ